MPFTGQEGLCLYRQGRKFQMILGILTSVTIHTYTEQAVSLLNSYLEKCQDWRWHE